MSDIGFLLLLGVSKFMTSLGIPGTDNIYFTEICRFHFLFQVWELFVRRGDLFCCSGTSHVAGGFSREPHAPWYPSFGRIFLTNLLASVSRDGGFFPSRGMAAPRQNPLAVVRQRF